MLQHVFNTLLKQMFGEFEQVVQHCGMRKHLLKKRVESSLNRFELSFTTDSTFPLFSTTLNGVEAL